MLNSLKTDFSGAMDRFLGSLSAGPGFFAEILVLLHKLSQKPGFLCLGAREVI
jgi:hypothetical protein